MQFWKSILLLASIHWSFVATSPTMVIFQGTHETARGCPQQKNIGANFTVCAIGCANSDTCQVCYTVSGVCTHCSIDLIISLNRTEEGHLIGLKVPDNSLYAGGVCSTNGMIEVSNKTLIDSTTVSQTTTRSSTIPSKTCPTGYTLVQRTNVFWCITVYFRNDLSKMSKRGAEKLCEQSGAQITGPDGIEETRILKEQGERSVNKLAQFADGTTGLGVWIDGFLRGECVRTGNLTDISPECDGINGFEFTDPYLSVDPSGYDWYEGEPGQRIRNGQATERCIQMSIFKNQSDPRNGKLFDVRCSENSDDMVERLAVACGKLAI